MEVIFAPAAAMIAWPWIAAVVGLAFAALYRHRPNRTTALAAVLWFAYAGYEYGMKTRVLCSGECNIRVDLLVIWPVLFFVAVLGVWRGTHTATKPPS